MRSCRDKFNSHLDHKKMIAVKGRWFPGVKSEDIDMEIMECMVKLYDANEKLISKKVRQK